MTYEALKSVVDGTIVALIRVYAGNYVICDDCGEVYSSDDDRCPSCGCKEHESYYFLDEFGDAPDIEVVSSINKEYRHARVFVGVGGPTVWVDTGRQEVAGTWGVESYKVHLLKEICEEIDTQLEEYWRSL